MTSQSLSTSDINRREFLYYLGGASAALLAAGSCGVLNLMLTPHLRAGVDFFEIDLSIIPASDQPPIAYPDLRVWISHVDQGVVVLRGFCTAPQDLSVMPKWVDTNYRFECPSCGSKYRKDGTYIEGPAKRGFDRYILHVTTPNGEIATDGSPVEVAGATRIVIYPQEKILGLPRNRIE